MPDDKPDEHDRFCEDRIGPAPGSNAPAPLLTDLYAQLLFPRIFRAGAAAARLDRLFAAGCSVLFVEIVGPLVFGRLTRTHRPDLSEMLRGLLVDPLGPVRRFPDHAGVMSLAGVLLLAVAWSACGAYIARGAALELGRNLRLKPSRTLGFALEKGAATLGAVLFVPAAVLVLLVVPVLLGVLLGMPGLHVIGAALFGVGLLASLVAAALLVVWVGAFWMMVPAVACDGADVFDAVQRAMGLMLNRPVSVGLHLALALVQGVVLIWLISLVADWGTAMAVSAAGLLREQGAFIAGSGGVLAGDWTTLERWSVFLVGLWQDLLSIAVMAYAVSYAHTAGVAVYLNARQIVDGQEPNEIWMPGDPAGVTSDPVAAAGTGPTENPRGTSGSA